MFIWKIILQLCYLFLSGEHWYCWQNGTTLKCLSIGTPKTINFPLVANGKLVAFRCPNIQAHYHEAVIYLIFGTPKNNEFSIWNK